MHVPKREDMRWYGSVSAHPFKRLAGASLSAHTPQTWKAEERQHCKALKRYTMNVQSTSASHRPRFRSDTIIGRSAVAHELGPSRSN